MLEAGTAGARDVVYLPGTNFNAATSLTLLTLLAQHCRVFAVDLPGQPGLSSPQRPQNETEAYSRWLAEVIGALPISAPGAPVLVGHSRGAAVALSADPAQVAGLLLLSPAGLVKAAVSRPVLATAVPWMARPNERRSAALLSLMTGSRRELHHDHTRWLTMVGQETRTTGAPGPLPPQVTERWRDATVRVVSGADDCFFLPARLAPVVRERLRVETVLLSEVGHLTVEEAPDAVLAHALALAAGR